MRLKSLADRISVHGNLEEDKNLYREFSAPPPFAEIAAFSSTGGGSEKPNPPLGLCSAAGSCVKSRALGFRESAEVVLHLG